MKSAMVMKSLQLLVIYWNLLQVSASEDLMLNSTLNDMRIAYSGQRIRFTCVTRHSQILQWSSEEYIGAGGRLLELLSSGVYDTDSSGDTTARRINTYSDNGVSVIMSELQLTTSLRHPTATVICTNNGLGQTESITFQTVAIPSEGVTLTSILNGRKTAYPEQRIFFTCVTRDSQILQWSSEAYIGMGGTLLELYSSGRRIYENSTINPHTFAMRLGNTSDNEPRVIVSELHLIASPQHQTATISCANNGHAETESITFEIANGLEVTSDYQETTILSSSTGESSYDTETERGVPGTSGSVELYVTLSIAGVLSVTMLIITFLSMVVTVTVMKFHRYKRVSHEGKSDSKKFPKNEYL